MHVLIIIAFTYSNNTFLFGLDHPEILQNLERLLEWL